MGIDALLTEHLCPHCGQRIIVGMHNHIIACAKLPDDAELAAQYESKGSCKALARKYGVHTVTLQRRLERAGVKPVSRGRYNKAGDVEKVVLHLWQRAFDPGPERGCRNCQAFKECRVMLAFPGLALCEEPDESQVAAWAEQEISVADVIRMSGGWLRENGHG